MSFNPMFKEHIVHGRKKHTIRRDITRKWKVGDPIHFATGEKEEDVFLVRRVSRIYEILIIPNEERAVGIIQKPPQDVVMWLSPREEREFVKREGFDSVGEFYEFIRNLYSIKPGKCLTARLIVWGSSIKYKGRKTARREKSVACA